MKRNCITCGKEFYVKPSQEHERKNCSKKCRDKYFKTSMIGENNPNWKNGGLKKCKECSVEFKTYNKNTVFCSNKCSGKYRTGIPLPKSDEGIENIRRAIKNRWVNYNVKQYYCGCGNEKTRKAITCKLCVEKKLSHLYKICLYCKNGFKAKSKIITFCSNDCYISYKKTLTKDKNPNWKGGLKIPNQRGRNTVEHNQWIKDVFERDDYTCLHCKKIGGELNAHHIKEWAKFPDERCNLDNGITLCVNCHHKVHKWVMKA